MVYCTVCGHDSRAVIEGTLRDNISSLRAVARMFNLSKTAVHRHKARHMASNGSARPDAIQDRYRAFVERFRGGRKFSMAEVRSWGYSTEELELFVQVAIERGELSRGGEAGQHTSGTVKK